MPPEAADLKEAVLPSLKDELGVVFKTDAEGCEGHLGTRGGTGGGLSKKAENKIKSWFIYLLYMYLIYSGLKFGKKFQKSLILAFEVMMQPFYSGPENLKKFTPKKIVKSNIN